MRAASENSVARKEREDQRPESTKDSHLPFYRQRERERTSHLQWTRFRNSVKLKSNDGLLHSSSSNLFHLNFIYLFISWLILVEMMIIFFLLMEGYLESSSP